MTPEAVRQWESIFRDFVIIGVAAFMLIYDTAFSSPNPYVIGGGLTLLGIPPALRLDSIRRRREDSE